MPLLQKVSRIDAEKQAGFAHFPYKPWLQAAMFNMPPTACDTMLIFQERDKVPAAALCGRLNIIHTIMETALRINILD